MSVKIVVENVNVTERNGTNERGPWTIREQEMWAHLYNKQGVPMPHPSRITIRLDKDQQPYQPGEYTLSPTSFYSGNYSALMFVPRLMPYPARPAMPKAA